MHVGYAYCMTTLQIRNVPEDVSRVLKSRAVQSGQSLSEYALGLLKRAASTPTIEELNKRIEARGRIDIETTAVDILRDEREAR
jgi:plasmid stability protein